MLHANQNERFSKRSFFAALDSGIYDLSTQTREPEGLPPDGGKTPANRLSLERPRALWARSGVQGHCPWGVAHETADGYVAADDHP